MFNRPHFKEYVLARLITVAILIFIVFSIFLIIVTPENQDGITPIFLLALAFSIFIFFIYKGAKRMQKELVTVNQYQNLIQALKKAKKREDIKQRYNAKLKLKNRQRADMLSAIAHEFRNPIASIMGYSQTLQDDPEIPKPLQEKFLGKIYNNGNKIEALLSRLILWNKFESGEATLHKSSFDIYTLLQEIKLVLEEQYKNREIVIKGASRIVEADRTLIELVLKNLIENALKYSKDEVLVTIDEDSISVCDKGVGISDEDLDKVTKKFYRSGTHNWDNSMGLGLSIVKTILTLHKSKLEIRSKIDEGSTFLFKI